ncbi:toprim domain-containing protein [Candidatus Dependentiae bacterium]|nr:toprim domain-containing protein [Candidatus Dependentiae bacterium]
MSLLDAAIQTGLNPKKVASTKGGEYHSSCPECGGKDRFFIQPNKKMKKCCGYYCCRRCGIYGDSIQFYRKFHGMSFTEALSSLGISDFSSNNLSSIVLTSNKRFEEAKFEPVLLAPPKKEWSRRGLLFVEECNENTIKDSFALQYLAKRGLPLDAVVKYKIGYNLVNRFDDLFDWGIEDAAKKSVWLPRGIVIPMFDEKGNVVRIKIRRSDYDDRSKFVVVSGGINGFGLVGNINCEVMVVVESELDAYAIHHAVGDFVFVVSAGSCITNPDNVTDFLAKRTKNLLICCDNDDAGEKMFEKWKRLYNHAERFSTPIGKDIGEYVESGGDVRMFFSRVLERVCNE